MDRAAAERITSPAAYAAAALALTAAGCAVAARRWGQPAEVWAGGLLAWAVQIGSFWPLWRRVRRGERALRMWIAGIAARAGGLGAVAAGGWLTAVELAPAATAYGLTLMVLLWLEALWLTRATGGTAGGGPSSA